MPCERIRTFDCLRVMTQRPRPDSPRLLNILDAERRRQRTGVPVVIPLDQHHPQPGMPRAPAVQCFERFAGMRLARMQQIAEKHQRDRLELGNQNIQAHQIVGGRTDRHRNAAGAKHSVLAEMRIGDEETPQRRIKSRAQARQHERMPGDFHRH